VVHIPPPAEELEARIETMCAFANAPDPPGAFVHPILRAIALHFWLAYDHPFVDGNGRTARALFYWSMLRQGYWLTEFVTISSVIKEAPAQYARAFLFVETDENDLTYFFEHQLSVVERSVAALIEYLERKQEAATIAPSIDANERQLALLAHAIRNPSTQYTIAGHQQRHGIVYDTARLDLHDLARRQYLTKRKRGREFVFLPGPRLRAFVARGSRERPARSGPG
jgi:Fic family protein